MFVACGIWCLADVSCVSPCVIVVVAAADTRDMITQQLHLCEQDSSESRKLIPKL